MKLPPKMPQRAMVRIWVASLHQGLRYPMGTGVSVLSALQKGLQGWIRTASTRRTVRRVKKPLCNSNDRCQRQKQGGAVGAAASRMRVPPKARCSRWEPRPGSLFCAARAIHPRPPKNRNVSKYAAVFIYNSDIFTSPSHQSSWARILFCTISPAGVRARMRPSKVAYPARTQFCTKASCAVENCLPYRVL